MTASSHKISLGIASTLTTMSLQDARFERIFSESTQRNLQRLLTFLFIATIVVNGIALGLPDMLSSKTLACLNMGLFTFPALFAFKEMVDTMLLWRREGESDPIVERLAHCVYFLALAALVAMNALYLMGYFDQMTVIYSVLVVAGSLTLFHGAKVYGWHRIDQWKERLYNVGPADHYPFGIASSSTAFAFLADFPDTPQGIQQRKSFVGHQSRHQFLITLFFIATVVVNALHFSSPDLLSSDLLTYSNMGLLALPACVVFKGIWDTPSRFREERVLHTVYFLALGALIAMNALYLFGYFNHEAIAYSTLAAAAALTIFHGGMAREQLIVSCMK